MGTTLGAALTPGAFLKLAKSGDDDEKTGEMQMLEISRQEIRKTVAENARGLTKLRQSLYVFWYCYIYEPVATGLRFVHLAIIFLPVIVTLPAVWLGPKIKDRNGQRTGTLWWYGFLVKSMERAGPAFIKVALFNALFPLIANLFSAGAMGRISNGHLSSRYVQYNVLSSFKCTSTPLKRYKEYN